MTTEELNAIRYLTIGLAKETFKQDWESFGEEDDDYIREKLALDNYCKGVEDVLRILENIKQEQRWIPVTERLPKEEGFYLVTRRITDDVATFIFRHTQTSKEYWKRCATAWMPLPEPYKEDKGWQEKKQEIKHRQEYGAT